MSEAAPRLTAREKRKAWVAKWPKTWIGDGDRLVEAAELAELRIELRDMVGPGHEVPKVFTASQPKALRIGIDSDLVAALPHVEPDRFKSWLVRWCTSAAYLRRIARGENRHDLQGRDVGKITMRHRLAARDMLVARGLAERVTAEEFASRMAQCKAQRRAASEKQRSGAVS